MRLFKKMQIEHFRYEENKKIFSSVRKSYYKKTHTLSVFLSETFPLIKFISVSPPPLLQ